ncbi:MAG: transcriptional regulator [Streptococcaceae bacterium]|nr:transcriptional regulator [Streptococcaceae bacterium]
MSEKIDKKNGQIILMLRKSKNLKLKDVTGGEFSESLLAKFEKGESDITIGKFLIVLKNLNVFFDEFQSIYNDYVDSQELIFRWELAEAYSKRDIKKIKEILNFWNDKAEKNPGRKDYEINRIVVTAVLAMAQNSKVLESDIEIIMNYLESIKEWGRYEIWIFGNCLRFVDDNALTFYGLLILGKTNFYQSIHLNEQMVIRTFLNLIDTFLKRGNLIQAMKYINHVKRIGIGVEFLYEKLMLVYHEAYYQYLLGDKEALIKMKECVKTLELCGFDDEAKSLYTEIKKCLQLSNIPK